MADGCWERQDVTETQGSSAPAWSSSKMSIGQRAGQAKARMLQRPKQVSSDLGEGGEEERDIRGEEG